MNYTNMADSKYDVIYYCSIIRSNSMTFTYFTFSILTVCYNVCFSTHASRFKVVESSCFFHTIGDELILNRNRKNRLNNW